MQAVPLYRDNLADQVAQDLMKQIQEGLQPGEALPSNAELAERYSVSRTVVREAFKLLEARGFITVTNGKRAIVRPISPEPLLVFFERASWSEDGYGTLLEAREAIELQNVKLAAQRRTLEQLKELQQLVTGMREHLDDTTRYIELDVQFHILIAQATHNPILVHLTQSIRETLKTTMMEGRLRRTTRAEIERAQELHELLLHELESGDALRAVGVMQQHFADQYQYLVADRVVTSA